MRRLRAILIVCAVLLVMSVVRRGAQLTSSSLAAGGSEVEPKPCADERYIKCPSRPEKECKDWYFGECMGFMPDMVCGPDTTHIRYCLYTEDCNSADGVDCAHIDD